MLSDYWWMSIFMPIWVRKTDIIRCYPTTILPVLLLPLPDSILYPPWQQKCPPHHLLYYHSINHRSTLPLPTSPFLRWSASLFFNLHFVEFELGRWWSHRGNNLNIYWFCDIPEPSQAGMLTHPSVTSCGLEGWAFWRSFSCLWMWDSTAVVWYWGQ